MHPRSDRFAANCDRALADAGLQRALTVLKTGFRTKRAAAVARLPEFEALRDAGQRVKAHSLAHLDHYLEAFEAKATAAGGRVHWARDAAEARRIVLEICRDAGARTVTKGKSMVSEEIGLNAFLEANGMTPVETDLGEYIIQLRGEPPSHIVAPACHLDRSHVAEAFRRAHAGLPADRPLAEPRALLDEARGQMRRHFLAADVGITGANLLIAETGSAIIVTNEGNGDLTQTLPRVQVVLATLEKVVPTLDDAVVILRLLARSASGQETAVYTTLSTGPRRPGDPDGPKAVHVVLLDNGRSGLLGGPFAEILGCIRCGACMNHCPVFGAVGGHAFGWVYPGPVGSVLTPALIGLERSAPLPTACTACGRCAEVCPVRIPLPDLLRGWRGRLHARRLRPLVARLALAAWVFAAARPRLYRMGARLAAPLVRLAQRLAKGRLGGVPAPATRGFIEQWHSKNR